MTRKDEVAVSRTGIAIQNLHQLEEFANMVLTAKMNPKGLDKIPQLCIAIQVGLELGLAPMQALASIAVINNKPTLYGEAGRALIHSHNLMADLQEGWKSGGDLVAFDPGWVTNGPPDDLESIVRVKRVGIPAWFIGSFSVAQAKAAGLWGKVGPWKSYWPDQIAWKARWRADKQAFADVFRGVRYREEVSDYEPLDVEATVIGDLEPVKEDSEEQEVEKPATKEESDPQFYSDRPEVIPVADETNPF